MTRDERERQLPELYILLINGRFQCRVCPKLLDSLDTVIDHILVHVQELPVRKGVEKKEVIRKDAQW